MNYKVLTLVLLTAFISCSDDNDFKKVEPKKAEPKKQKIIIKEEPKGLESISTGYKHVLVLNEIGNIIGWGTNETNELGEKDYSIKPEVISDGEWKCISAGYESSVLIKKDGTLWGTGYNNSGQLGNGNSETLKTITQIGIQSNWEKISLGYRHTIALKKDGTIWTWGNNEYFQLGNGTDKPSTVPIQVNNDNDWCFVAAGYNQSLAIKKDGSLWAWGYNFYGQLGVGSNGSVPVPQKVNESKWRSVDAGIASTGAIKEDGTLWMWGKNYYGELGLGTGVLDNENHSNVPLQVGTDSDWTKISVGKSHVLALKADNTLWSWGQNMNGELGIGGETGSKKYKNIPVKVNDDTDWKDVSASEFFSVAQKNDNSYWGWGSNKYKQISADNKKEPLPIKIELKF